MVVWLSAKHRLLQSYLGIIETLSCKLTLLLLEDIAVRGNKGQETLSRVIKPHWPRRHWLDQLCAQQAQCAGAAQGRHQ
jgi:hypothetical protein